MSNRTSRLPFHGVVDLSIPQALALENGFRPRWLLTDFSKSHWVVTDIGAKPNRTIRFDVRLPNGKRLTDYSHLVESIKRVVYGLRTGPLMQIESGSVQATVAANLIILARWMIANGIHRFDDLTPSDTRQYTELAAYGVHSVLNSESILIQHLERLNVTAGFEIDDTQTERCIKAGTAFPFYTRYKSGRLRLERKRILEDAGLDGVGANAVITSILDDFESLCGFYQLPRTKRRLESTLSIDETDDVVITEEQLRRLLMPFEYLYRHRRYLDDGIQQALFVGTSARNEAQKLGKTVGRTRSIPVKQAATLIERSIRWIIDYAPELLDVKDWADSLGTTGPDALARIDQQIRSKSWPDPAPSGPFPILTGYWKAAFYESQDTMPQAIALRQGMTLPLALNFLLTACATVIAAFSARRAAAIIGLKAGCIERDELGQPWMKVFIHKTTQADAVIPVPEVVASAVAVLERVSERARAYTGTPYLFQLNVPGTDEYQGVNADGLPTFRLGFYLKKFGYFVDVPDLPDGTRWAFKPHQFRRFFAILYIWIYELGDWGALSYHLRHFNPEMTRRYASDEELGHIISVADKERTAQILTNAAMGKSQLSGIVGERLKEAADRMYSRMSQQVQVVHERKLAQRILRFVERTGVKLQPLLWGYCAHAPGSQRGTCSCSPSQNNVPELRNATISTCAGCQHSIRTAAFLPYVEGSLRFHREIVHAPDAPEILRKASQTIILELKDYIASVGPANSLEETSQ